MFRLVCYPGCRQPGYGWTDGRTDITKLIVAFGNLTKAPINSNQSPKSVHFLDTHLCVFTDLRTNSEYYVYSFTDWPS